MSSVLVSTSSVGFSSVAASGSGCDIGCLSSCFSSFSFTGSSVFFFEADFGAGLPPMLPALGFPPIFDFAPVDAGLMSAGFLAAEVGLVGAFADVFVVVVVLAVVFG